MRPAASVLVLVASTLVTVACAQSADHDDAREWQHVLTRKKAAASPDATPHTKQVYADTLGAFVQKHPDHPRARAVYRRIQLDFAHELASLGRYQDSIRFYRAVLNGDPTNEEATAGVKVALDRLAITRAKLLALEKGMTKARVAQLLGKPVPGWSRKNDDRDEPIEAWYYRTTEGGLAGVYFRDGVVFAAEADSGAKLAVLGR